MWQPRVCVPDAALSTEAVASLCRPCPRHADGEPSAPTPTTTTLRQLRPYAVAFQPGASLHQCARYDACLSACADGVSPGPAVNSQLNALIDTNPLLSELRELTVATANVNTLLPGEYRWKASQQAAPATSRMVELEARFQKRGLAMIGIQEARIQGDVRTRCGAYSVFRAGATPEGRGGTELWLVHKFARLVSAVIVSSPRLIRVILGIGGVSLHVVVAHAPVEPTNEASQLDADTFWRLLSGVLSDSARRGGDATIVLMGANSRVGSVITEHIGSCDTAAENANGAELRTTCSEHSLHAINTFWPAGHTWTGVWGHKARIDYVLCSARLAPVVASCAVASDIDLSTGEREDHRVLTVSFGDFLAGLCAGAPEQLRLIATSVGAPKFKASSLKDPSRQAMFEEKLSSMHPLDLARQGDSMNCRQLVDDVSNAWAADVLQAAISCFETEKSVRTKPWMSSGTWETIQLIGRTRARLRQATTQRDRIGVAACLLAWKACSLEQPAPTDDDDDLVDTCPLEGHSGRDRGSGPQRNLLRGTRASGCGTDAAASPQHFWEEPLFWLPLLRLRRACDIHVAVLAHALARLVSLRRPLVRRDKADALRDRADAAQRAADAGDSKKVYAIARSMSGQSSAPLATIRSSKGEMLTERSSVQERWREHFTEVFSAKHAPSVADLAAVQQTANDTPCDELLSPPPRKRRSCKQRPFQPNVDDVYNAILKLNGDKGLGPDQLSASVLKAGGWAIAQHIHTMIQWAISHSYLPIAWRGGKLVVLYKGKGSPQEVDSYRGLLVTSHTAKVLASLLQNHLANSYAQQVGVAQFGAVARRGTGLAILALRSHLDLAKLTARSASITFVDLTKAFDLAVRELALGWLEGAPATREGRIAHLSKLGLQHDACEAIVNTIERDGSIFQQLGIDHAASAAARSLHTAAWFQLPGDETVLETQCGGRQGCKLGAVLFNMIYALALRHLTAALLRHGIVLVLPAAPRHVWGNPPPESDAADGPSAPLWFDPQATPVPLVELTYVDDEALLLSSTSPAALLRAHMLSMQILTDTFHEFGFRINWKAGKTECMFVWRGKHAVAHQRLHRPGSLLPPLRCGTRARIVDSYVYLGSVVTPDNNVVPDANRRSQKAMITYAPLSVSLFGSARTSRKLRLGLASSLCWSRLLHAVAAWTSCPRRSYSVLNVTYMRVLRRVAGKPRFDKESAVKSDKDIRAELMAPSLYALIARRRLQLLASALCGDSPIVPSLLAMRVPGTAHGALPWLELVLSDMTELQQAVRPLLDELGDPWMHGHRWTKFIMEWPGEWKQLLARLAPSSTAADAPSVRQKLPAQGAQVQQNNGHACADCGMSFSTEKAMQQHRRIRHACRQEARCFVSGPQCPVCGITFTCRPKVLAHLADVRCRGSSSRSLLPCGARLKLGMYEPLPAAEVEHLDQADRVLRASARKQGHTQPRAIGRAARAKCRGMVAATPPDRLPSKRARRKTSIAGIFWALKRCRPDCGPLQRQEEQDAKRAKRA